MISKESHHKAFNEPLAHMKKNLVQTLASPNKPRKTYHYEPKVKMIACINHDDIEFWQPKKSYR